MKLQEKTSGTVAYESLLVVYEEGKPAKHYLGNPNPFTEHGFCFRSIDGDSVWVYCLVDQRIDQYQTIHVPVRVGIRREITSRKRTQGKLFYFADDFLFILLEKDEKVTNRRWF